MISRWRAMRTTSWRFLRIVRVTMVFFGRQKGKGKETRDDDRPYDATPEVWSADGEFFTFHQLPGQSNTGTHPTAPILAREQSAFAPFIRDAVEVNVVSDRNHPLPSQTTTIDASHIPVTPIREHRQTTSVFSNERSHWTDRSLSDISRSALLPQ